VSAEETTGVGFEQPPKTGLIDAIKKGFKGYVVWNARSTRAEYWWWALFAVVVGFVASVIDSAAGLDPVTSATPDTWSVSVGGGPIATITGLVLFLPGLSVLVRRLHDTDRSGWWVWISLVPLIGLIVLLVFVLLPCRMGPTRWNNRVPA